MLSAQDLDGFEKISPFRNRKLFSEFLPIGYGLTTLDSVDEKDRVIELKVILGALITLYDDYADRPDRLNPRLLSLLYRIPFEEVEVNVAFLSQDEKLSLALAKSLFKRLMKGLETLRNYGQLFPMFCFDLKQFFLANQYCELLTENPLLSNELENRMYLHHNMGIVMAGMMDLMSIRDFDISELGLSRSLFLLGQRAGRISNVVTTYEREQQENDLTNEMFAVSCQKRSMSKLELLEQELQLLIEEMNKYKNIKSFSVPQYQNGIQSLHRLHKKLKGII
jgi:hypothetical protein